MPAPSEANIQDAIRRSIKCLDGLQGYGSTWITNEDAVKNNVVSLGPYNAPALAAIDAARSSFAAAVSGASAAACIAPGLASYVRFISTDPLGDVQDQIDRLFRYMDSTAKTVNSRDIVYGAPAAGVGNVGNGTIRRVYFDPDEYEMENVHVEAKAARVVQDQASGGEKGEEVFEFRGTAARTDAIDLGPSGAVARIRALSARDSFLDNPSFSNYAGTIAVPTTIEGWTPTTNISNFEIDTTNYYLASPGDATPASVKFKSATDTLTQALVVNGISKRNFDPNVPYLLRLAYNAAVGTAVGDIVITIGAVSRTIAVTGAVGWNIAEIIDFGTPTTQDNLYYKNFRANNLSVSIQFVRTSGFLLVDEVLLVPGQPFDGTFYFPIGGATPWAYDDTFTWSDSETGAVIQEWFWRAFGRYLPHATGAAETWADP